MVESQPWRNPPIKEAIFEMRFSPVNDYSLFVGSMAAANREKFPSPQKLPTADLPLSIVIEGQVIHRFSNKEKTIIFQTGQDVISVNSILYHGFSSFLVEIKNILESAREYITTTSTDHTVKAISIRYINVFADIKDPFQALNIKSPFENGDKSAMRAIQLQYVKQEDSLLITTVLAFPVEQSNLLLDLSISSQEQELSWDVEQIIQWVSQSHEIIYKNFEEIVSDSEKQKRK